MTPLDYSKVVITAEDIMNTGFCLNPGLKEWCAAYGFDFRDLIKNGITMDKVIDLPDAHSRAVIEHKLKGINDGRE